MVPFHRLESKMTNLSLDFDWFLLSLIKYITIITKKVMVLHKNGAVSPVGI